MDDNDILAAIRLAAEEEAEIPPEAIRLDADASTVPGWDSLAHTRIIMNLEARLDVELDMNSTMQAATFGDLVGVVRNTLAAKG
jgi:acyl carrier protein